MVKLIILNIPSDSICLSKFTTYVQQIISEMAKFSHILGGVVTRCIFFIHSSIFNYVQFFSVIILGGGFNPKLLNILCCQTLGSHT